MTSLITNGNVRILKDSLHPNGVDRFTTFLIRFPKCLLAELNTHRVLVRNVGSSRAIPTTTVIDTVMKDPFIPYMTRNKKGMQGTSDLSSRELYDATKIWLLALEAAVEYAQRLKNINIHKQDTNRLLEPFMQVELVISGTEWDNFFKLRTAEATQPDFKLIAQEMYEQYIQNQPDKLDMNDWHIPFDEMLPEGVTDLETKIKVAVARCARISYQSHSGEFSLEKDLRLFDQLKQEGHYSPFEHIARAVPNRTVSSATLLDDNNIMIDPQLFKFMFSDKQTNPSATMGYILRWTRQYSGFYTYRHHLEDGVSFD